MRVGQARRRDAGEAAIDGNLTGAGGRVILVYKSRDGGGVLCPATIRDERRPVRVGQSRRRDAGEAAIVTALQQIGVSVWRISGAGVPDLLCYSRGVWLPIEVKTLTTQTRRARTDPKGRSLTPAQWETHARTQFPIVATVAEALALFGVF